jgi:hypothetical protein
MRRFDMDRKNRSRLIIGVLLILLGIWFLLVQLVPGIANFVHIELSWPIIVVGVGLFLLLFGLLANEPGMAIPACIVGGIGCILYWQNATGNWESWAYAWTLIPGFVGVGILLSGILEGKFRSAWSSAGSLLLISLFLFLIFGSLFGDLPFGDYWPILIILLGVWLFIRTLFRMRR